MQQVLVIFKALVSLGLLAYLLVSVNLSTLVALISRISLIHYAAAIAVGGIAVVLSTYKWRVILRNEELDCPSAELLRYYLIGIYFNNFLPTSIGGDAARVYLLARRYGHRKKIFYSVLVERFTGLMALVFFLTLGVVWGPRVLGGDYSVLLGPVFLLGGGLFLIFFNRQVLARFVKMLPGPLQGYVEMVGDRLGHGIHFSKVGWTVVWTSVFFQFLGILIYLLVAQSLSLTVTFSDLMLIVPLVTLLTLIPLSLNGLGIREGGFVVLLSGLGVPASEALSLSLLYYAITLLLSLCGWGLWLFSRGGEAQSMDAQ